VQPPVLINENEVVSLQTTEQVRLALLSPQETMIATIPSYNEAENIEGATSRTP
jgi:hypothetical protein